MPNEWSIHLPRDQMEKIQKRCGKIISNFDYGSACVKSINEEIDHSFVRTQNKMIFDAEVLAGRCCKCLTFFRLVILKTKRFMAVYISLNTSNLLLKCKQELLF